MNKLLFAAILSLLFLSNNSFAQSKTYFQSIAGNWEGTLEYQDYQENKRVILKTYLIIKSSADGNSAEITTVYDDFGRIIKDIETEKIDLAAKRFLSGDFEYKIESAENGKIVLLGSGQDGEKVEPIRKTITYDKNSLVFLKETRAPWQFRNQTVLKRTTENPLAKRILTTAQMREDLDVLKKTLTAIHPGIYKPFDKNFYEILPNENTDNYPQVTPYENNFRGRAYIISDASNASATFQFLSYAQENKLSAIVGQTTGGNKQGINGGNYFFLYLPNSKVETDIPVYFQVPLSPQEDESIIPDILVKRDPHDVGENIDREVLTIKNLIIKNK